MTLKAKLLHEIEEHSNADLSTWQSIQQRLPFVRLRTLGPKHIVQISTQKGEWFEPNIWKANYQASVSERFGKELLQANDVLGTDRIVQDLQRVLGEKVVILTADQLNQRIMKAADDNEQRLIDDLVTCLSRLKDADHDKAVDWLKRIGFLSN
jgi:hypothetical protein